MRWKSGMAAIALACSAIGSGASAAKPSKAEIDRAAKMLDAIDMNKLFSDDAYAAALLPQLELARPLNDDTDYVAEIDLLRAVALMNLNRNAEANAAIDAAVTAAPQEPRYHYVSLLTPGEKDTARSIANLARADRMLTDPRSRADFLKKLDEELVFAIRRPAVMAGNEALLETAATALLSLGWPIDQQASTRDRLFVDLVDGALLRNDFATAKAQAAKVTQIASTVELLVVRKYAPITWAGDPQPLLAKAIAAEDAHSGRALAAKPGDYKMLLRRAGFLRAVGRNDDALLLLEPKLNAIIDGTDKTEDGFWVVNEAAYALAQQGRPKDAAALMKRLITLRMEDHPELISMSINMIEIMMQAGDYAGAAAHSEMLAAKGDKFASPYGMMWIWSGAACAHSFGGKADKAKPWLDKLKAGEKDNEAAFNRALLCANDLDGSAALLVRRLNGPQASSLLTAVQDYRIADHASVNREDLEKRWRKVLGRPEVKAAIERHGRILSLPLSRTYYGDL